jgi:uncharacterized protein YxjI
MTGILNEVQHQINHFSGPTQNYLPPIPTPLLVTEQRFIVAQPTILKLSEEIMSHSGDDFTIVDSRTNQLWFRVDGKVFSIKQKKILMDYMGQPICNMQKKLFSIKDTQELYKGSDGPQICNITKKFSFLKTKITAKVVNLHDNQTLTIHIKGDWREKNAIISIGSMKEGGIPIAQLSRSLGLKEMFFKKQDYYLSIAPGVDAAFVCMLCVAIDEMVNEK